MLCLRIVFFFCNLLIAHITERNISRGKVLRMNEKIAKFDEYDIRMVSFFTLFNYLFVDNFIKITKLQKKIEIEVFNL